MKVEAELQPCIGMPNTYDVYLNNTLAVGGFYITELPKELSYEETDQHMDVSKIIQLKNSGFTANDIAMLSNEGVI